jgi:hypothetical protein
VRLAVGQFKERNKTRGKKLRAFRNRDIYITASLWIRAALLVLLVLFFTLPHIKFACCGTPFQTTPPVYVSRGTIKLFKSSAKAVASKFLL